MGTGSGVLWDVCSIACPITTLFQAAIQDASSSGSGHLDFDVGGLCDGFCCQVCHSLS